MTAVAHFHTAKDSKEDLFGRQEIIEFLMGYLKSDPGSFVLNIDSSWGTGKTFFLKMWEEHLQNQKGELNTIFFDAWKTDYCDDPFIALVSLIIDSLELDEGKSNKVKAAVGKIGLSIAKEVSKQFIKSKLGTDFKEIGEVINSVNDELSKLASAELDEFKKKQKGVDEFIDLITEQVKDKPLYIFIDELDRCRPLYAIEVLERVKHLFSIPNIKFIIATDTEQLCHSISAVYGNGFDSRSYLRRFFDQSYTLPKPDYEAFSKALFEGKHIVNSFVLTGREDFDFAQFAKGFSLSLRDMQQCFIRYRAIINGVENFSCRVHHWLTIYLTMLKLKREGNYNQLRSAITVGDTESLRKLTDEVSIRFTYGFDDEEYDLCQLLSFYFYDGTSSYNVASYVKHFFTSIKSQIKRPGIFIFEKHIKAVELAANLN